MDNPFTLIWLALSSASISFTLTKTPMFDFVRRLLPEEGMLQELWGCPYCMSHWVAMFLVGFTRPEPFTGTPFDWLISVFVIVTISALVVQLIILISEVLKFLRQYEH
jgi:hypothetical protein